MWRNLDRRGNAANGPQSQPKISYRCEQMNEIAMNRTASFAVRDAMYREHAKKNASTLKFNPDNPYQSIDQWFAKQDEYKEKHKLNDLNMTLLAAIDMVGESALKWRDFLSNYESWPEWKKKLREMTENKRKGYDIESRKHKLETEEETEERHWNELLMCIEEELDKAKDPKKIMLLLAILHDFEDRTKPLEEMKKKLEETANIPDRDFEESNLPPCLRSRRKSRNNYRYRIFIPEPRVPIRAKPDSPYVRAMINGRRVDAYINLGSEYVTIKSGLATSMGLKLTKVDWSKYTSEQLSMARNYASKTKIPHYSCQINLKVDMAQPMMVTAYVICDYYQKEPLIVGQAVTGRPNITVMQENGVLRVFNTSDLNKLYQQGRANVSYREILSFGGLLNQLQPNVRWSSSLKIQDKEAAQPDRGFKYADLSVRLAAPQQLQPKPNVSDLQFGKYFTDHMLKVFYYEALGGWQTPEITPFENLVLHPAAKVLHYAIELFEGMKAYRGVDGKIRVFRPEMNMDRMNASALRSGLPTFNGLELIKCINKLISIDQEWVPHSEASSLYIRPTLIGIDPTLGVATSESAMLYVILSPVGTYFKSHEAVRGVSLLADPRYTRAWPGGCGDRKMGSNYAPTIHVQKEATEKGLQQVLWLYGEDQQLTEAGTMNVFLFCINDEGEKELITPPLNGLILPGITRNSILALSKEWNQFKVTQRKITMKEVVQLLSENRLLELFGAGTACIVSPISYIDYMDQGLHIPTMDHAEPIHRAFLKRLTEIHYGYVDHPWAFPIE